MNDFTQDQFIRYIKYGTGKWHDRALTDKSLQGGRDESVTNVTLATYGDAVLKLALCELLLDRYEELTIEKAKYESDVSLIKVAKQYRLLNYLHFNRRGHLPQDYQTWEIKSSDGKGKKERLREHNSRRKYIATAMEAILGAIYKDHRDLGEIVEIVNDWVEFLDAESAKKRNTH